MGAVNKFSASVISFHERCIQMAFCALHECISPATRLAHTHTQQQQQLAFHLHVIHIRLCVCVFVYLFFYYYLYVCESI